MNHSRSHVTSASGERAIACCLLLTTFILSACASVPADPFPPFPDTELSRPPAWIAGDAQLSPANSRSVPRLAWQQFYVEPLLQDRIEAALSHHQDLHTAMSRVDEARSLLEDKRTERSPGLGAHPLPSHLNNWELELWGRIRSANPQALPVHLGTSAGQRAAQAALVRQVARSHIALRSLDAHIDLAERVGQTDSQLLEPRRAFIADSLVQLTGLPESSFARTGEPSGDWETVIGDIPEGTTSDIIVNRPDMVAAEGALKASGANVIAARAAFVPRIALTSRIGSASMALQDLFGLDGHTWQFEPTMGAPIFDSGAQNVAQNLESIRSNPAISHYENMIEVSLREARYALHRRLTAMQQFHQLLVQRQKLRALEPVPAQDSVLAEQQFIHAREKLLIAQIDLFSALGGGTNTSHRRHFPPHRSDMRRNILTGRQLNMQ